MALEVFKQGQEWWIRLPDGRAVNLNTRAGASFVLALMQENEQLKNPPKRRRKKPGPSETKTN